MTPYQRDLRRVARQLDRAADRIEKHGFAQYNIAARRDHDLGFDIPGAIKPTANNPSPAIVSLAMWYVAREVFGDRLPNGMRYSPWRALEFWCDSFSASQGWAVEFIRRAAMRARQDAL